MLETQQAETATADKNEEKPPESSSQPVSRNDDQASEENQTDSAEEKKPDPVPGETNEPVTEAPPEPEPTQKPDPEPEPVEEPVTKPEPEPAFDIDYWISFARNLAESKGLVLDSTAVECWDNPITANPECIYLERDLTSRISRYADDEDISAVWIWYESAGSNEYLIYIGYA
ncbi:MAG: procyclic acidic repetitive family protein [Lachnospiraceae bacterium]|nr:procyclic acidic repetitive family protein [Lachnospiraceae bacterium]